MDLRLGSDWREEELSTVVCAWVGMVMRPHVRNAIDEKFPSKLTDWKTSKGRKSNFRSLHFEMGINIAHMRNLLIPTQ